MSPGLISVYYFLTWPVLYSGSNSKNILYHVYILGQTPIAVLKILKFPYECMVIDPSQRGVQYWSMVKKTLAVRGLVVKGLRN